jgi:branched-chain amino acid transport system ATP-binding protein
MSAILETEGLTAGYGAIEILHDLSVSLEEGTLVTIVGANGAGKTTLLLALSGLVKKRAGSVRFDGADITNLPSHAIVQRGLAHVPEGRRMLPSMSVEENLLVAADARPSTTRARDIAALYERFPILGTRRAVAAGSLSGGEAQMLAIARALVMKPRALLLDEPSMGLAPKLVAEIFAILAEERARGTSILLVEQNARRSLAIADRGYVLERGRVTASGTGGELLADPKVVAAYLGG